MIDYHLHTERSHDAAGSIIETCEAALRVGLGEICITEHLDFEPADACYGYFNYDLIKKDVDEAREKFAGRLVIRFGAEFDFIPKYLPQIQESATSMEFDYILGAVHWINETPLVSPDECFAGKTAIEAYTPYFETVLALVETGIFDSLAHLDVCKRHGTRYFGPFDYRPFSEIIDRILRGVIERDMCLEVNSSGLRRGSGETFPGRPILQRYFDLGGRLITIGSDSHNPENVGFGIDQAVDLIKEIGFNQISVFNNRVRTRKAI